MSESSIKFKFDEKNLYFTYPEDIDFVSAAKDNSIYLPISGCSRVYTCCASIVQNFLVEQIGSMGCNDDLQEKAFTFLCVAYLKSDLHILVGDESEFILYNDQFGKY